MNETNTISEMKPPAATPVESARALEAEKHPTLARQKTWGERIFNWRTYGGIALLGNEATSLIITQAVEADKVPLYAKFSKFLSDRRPGELDGVKRTSDYIFGNKLRFLENGKPMAPRLPFLLAACIGGMFMVPFVKFAEDNKGRIVRRLDRKHYGDLTDTDPKLIEAHKEMDEAPKQTWGSLWKGRAITVAAAVTVDATMGWHDAPSTKLIKNPTLNRFSSMDRIAKEIANGAVGGVNKLRTLFDKAPMGEIPTQHTKYWVKQASWLMVLSTTLTVLFFASSKLFAKRNEQKEEKKQEQRIMRANGTYADVTEDAPEADKTTPETGEKPTAQVSSIHRADQPVSVRQLSQSM